MTKKDYILGTIAGLLIGLLFLPVFKTTKSDFFDTYALVAVFFFLIATPVGLVIFKKLSEKISVLWQVGKFGVIGVLNTLVDWGVLVILILAFRKYFIIESSNSFIFGLTFYSLYKAISFIIANINSYYWNKYWTFSSGILQKTKVEYLQFLAVSVVGFLLNVGIATYVFSFINPIGGLNTDQWGIIGAVVGSVAGLIWNFLGYKFVVFKQARLDF
ncbi:hypothetical protein COV23_01090 [Candidatus Wolfebacteria bacterium CG10_big_fil_rev_8_21_14_0_10_31_9]|uniref:GtrA/DPMS transmembrane domain-containing protein n=1 Tax=Candidatus Wolfebacteria bacterium CG10_big_fil_rev_8_21_14_0_10_31_9 TaxID=1975070 RepID=A0A2H0RCE8_9BACT|nr:MAG: hypothetical protein COV23_01090 [Candidatus Wolfebacteria bacterium CG10_big_fil_rev_8_21_14_0_10_31_9]